MSGLNENWINLVAGGAAGLVTSIVVCPLETIKTKFQSQTPKQLHLRPYRGIVDAFVRISKDEGVKGLYRGLGLYTSSHIPSWTCYFACYSRFKTFYSTFNLNPPLVHMYASFSSGLISSLLTSPVWVVRTRLIVQSEQSGFHYTSSLDAFKTIWKHEGVRGFYKGIVPGMFGTLQMGIQLPIYEYLKLKLCPDDGFSPVQILLSSILSKTIAGTAGYPHQVVRTRFQINNTCNPRLSEAVREIYRQSGPAGFYKGLGAALLKTVPATVVTFFTYEYTLFLLKTH